MSNPKEEIQLSAAKIKDALCLRELQSHEIIADIISNCLQNTKISDLRFAQDDSVSRTAVTADCSEDHHALQHLDLERLGSLYKWFGVPSYSTNLQPVSISFVPQ